MFDRPAEQLSNRIFIEACSITPVLWAPKGTAVLLEYYGRTKLQVETFAANVLWPLPRPGTLSLYLPLQPYSGSNAVKQVKTPQTLPQTISPRPASHHAHRPSRHYAFPILYHFIACRSSWSSLDDSSDSTPSLPTNAFRHNLDLYIDTIHLYLGCNSS